MKSPSPLHQRNNTFGEFAYVEEIETEDAATSPLSPMRFERQQSTTTPKRRDLLSRITNWMKQNRESRLVALPSDSNLNRRRTSVQLMKHRSEKNLQTDKRFGRDYSWLKRIKKLMDGQEMNYHELRKSHSIEMGLPTICDSDEVYFDSLSELNTIKSIVIDVAYALTCYGIASHRLDYFVQMMGMYFGLCCDTWPNPMGIWITFSEACIIERGNRQLVGKTNHFARVRSSALNLTKLHLLEQLATNIFKGKISVSKARQLLKDIISASPVYDHFMLLILSRVLSSVMFSIFFNANLAEILAAAIAGIASGLLAILARNFDNYSQVNVICTGIISGAIAIIIKYCIADYYYVSAFVVSLAGVIALIPGFGIAVSVLELSAGFMDSGSCRLISSFLTTLQIAFGALVSHKIAAMFPSYAALPENLQHAPIPLWIKGVLLPINIISVMISQRSPIFPMALLFTFVTCYCSFFISNLVSEYVHSRATATFVASVVVGMISNSFGWISQKHSGIIISSVAITFLLPGSLGFRSIQAFFNDDTTGSLQFIMDVVTVCFSLTIGLLVSNVLIPAKKKLRW
jgi:uncharacterized membrane protein YjjP (DUF1212 family)